jgi:hypothetical protein
MGPEANKYVRKHALDKVHDAVVCDEIGSSLRVVLLEENEHDWSESINAFMLSEGLAIMDQP